MEVFWDRERGVMKHQHMNEEPIVFSAEDADAAELFVLRRSFDTNGRIKYSQIVGPSSDIEDYARNIALTSSGKVGGERGPRKAVSLARVVMERMLGRPLATTELVVLENGKNNDVRWENLLLIERSSLSSKPRASTSRTGEKYI